MANQIIGDFDAFLAANPTASGQSLTSGQSPADIPIVQRQPPPPAGSLSQIPGYSPGETQALMDLGTRWNDFWSGGGDPQPETPQEPGVFEAIQSQVASGATSTGFVPVNDPGRPPSGAELTTENINAWLNQFGEGGPDRINAQYNLEFMTGTGQFLNRTWNPETQAYDDAPGQATDTASVLPGPADNAGGQDSDIAKAFEDYISTASKASEDAAKLAQTNQDNLVSMFQDQIAASTAQNQQMMTMMMGLMNPRREDEQRGSFTYNALGGR